MKLDSNLFFPVSVIPSFVIQWYLMWRLKSQITAGSMEEIAAKGGKSVLGFIVILQILLVVLIIVFASTRDMDLNEWIFYGISIGILVFSLVAWLITSKVAPKKGNSSSSNFN